MGEEKSGYCHISNPSCKAPAGYGISGVGWAHGDNKTRAKCYQCGEFVCTDPGCSKILWWRVYEEGGKKRGRKRICYGCEEMEFQEIRNPESDEQKKRSHIFRHVKQWEENSEVGRIFLDLIKPLMLAIDLGFWDQAKYLFEYLEEDLRGAPQLHQLLAENLSPKVLFKVR